MAIELKQKLEVSEQKLASKQEELEHCLAKVELKKDERSKLEDQIESLQQEVSLLQTQKNEKNSKLKN